MIWKECRARRVRDPKALAAVFGEVLSGVRVVRVGGEAIGEVLELAIAEGITFYDAAYLHAARRLGLKLVTEDSEPVEVPGVAGRGGVCRGARALEVRQPP